MCCLWWWCAWRWSWWWCLVRHCCALCFVNGCYWRGCLSLFQWLFTLLTEAGGLPLHFDHDHFPLCWFHRWVDQWSLPLPRTSLLCRQFPTAHLNLWTQESFFCCLFLHQWTCFCLWQFIFFIKAVHLVTAVFCCFLSRKGINFYTLAVHPFCISFVSNVSIIHNPLSISRVEIGRTVPSMKLKQLFRGDPFLEMVTAYCWRATELSTSLFHSFARWQWLS